jgi:hypothetical protein
MAGFRGAGKVYLSVNESGTYTGYLDMANVANFTLGNDGGEEVTLKSTAPVNYGAVIGSASTPGDDTITIALNVPNRKNLSIMLLGSDTNISETGTTASNDITPLSLGSILPLTKRHVSAVTVTSKDATDAGTWVATTETALGKYIKPTVGNTYYYKATARTGTFLTGSTQPTWPTGIGETVVDGEVTWTNVGLIVKSATDDYAVDGVNGLIEIKSTATSIEIGRVLTVAFTYASYSGYKIDARTRSNLDCKVLFVGQNLDNSEYVRLTADSVSLSPEGDFQLISPDNEFLEFTLSGTIKVPEGETVPFIMEVTS